jgi:cation-transporting P-type ATPase E
LENQ